MVMKRQSKTSFIVATLAGMLVVFSTLAMGQTEKPKPEQFSATVYPQAGVFAGRMTQINLYVNGYTPDDEANQLRDLLRTKGQDALLNTIEKLKQLVPGVDLLKNPPKLMPVSEALERLGRLELQKMQERLSLGNQLQAQKVRKEIFEVKHKYAVQ